MGPRLVNLSWFAFSLWPGPDSAHVERISSVRPNLTLKQTLEANKLSWNNDYGPILWFIVAYTLPLSHNCYFGFGWIWSLIVLIHWKLLFYIELSWKFLFMFIMLSHIDSKKENYCYLRICQYTNTPSVAWASPDMEVGLFYFILLFSFPQINIHWHPKYLFAGTPSVYRRNRRWQNNINQQVLQ